MGRCGGEEPLAEEFYVGGLLLLAGQLTGRSWQAEPARPASLHEAITRIFRLGRGDAGVSKRLKLTFFIRCRYMLKTYLSTSLPTLPAPKFFPGAITVTLIEK